LSFSRPVYLALMKKASAILAVVMFMAASLFAADLTGTWNAKVNLGDQQGEPTFVLEQDGNKLTGTYSGALGEAPIKGTVKGDEITIDFDASGAAVHYAGQVDKSGNKMEGTVDYGGQASGTFTATRK
jgi:hypothetical protein